jgi:8-oxo-dGTP pyrophosphatase MutT (NUDIX family)
MRVREDAICRGSEGIYGIVEKPDSVVIVPVEDDGRINLVQQYRYPIGARYWEFPQGAWEQTPGADPDDVARGELQEKTGLNALRWYTPDISLRRMAILIRAATCTSLPVCDAARPTSITSSKTSSPKRFHCATSNE